MEYVYLGPHVPLVFIQFSGTKLNRFLPSDFPRLEPEELRESTGRKTVHNGKLFIDRVRECDLSMILRLCNDGDYEIFAATSQQRISNKPDRGGTYWMIRFQLARRDSERAHISPEFTAIADTVTSVLRELVTDYVWRLRAFINPYRIGDTVVPDTWAISLNPEISVPKTQLGNRQAKPVHFGNEGIWLE